MPRFASMSKDDLTYDVAHPFVLHTRIVAGTGGGPEKTILNSPRHLRDLGYESACAYLHPPDDPGLQVLELKAKESGAELISVPDKGKIDITVIKKLVRLCRERKVAIWHGHDYKTNVLGLIVRRFHKMKLVSTVHGWVNHLPSDSPLYYWLDRQASKAA